MKLSKPSKAVRRRILSKVDFPDRFVAYRLRERQGVVPVTAYRFKEIVAVLNDPRPFVKVEALVRWVREVMGDEALGDAMETAAGGESNDHERLTRIREKMEERLAQCEEEKAPPKS